MATRIENTEASWRERRVKKQRSCRSGKLGWQRVLPAHYQSKVKLLNRNQSCASANCRWKGPAALLQAPYDLFVVFSIKAPGMGAKYQGYCVYNMFFACLFMRYILNEMMMVKKTVCAQTCRHSFTVFQLWTFFCCRQPRSWPTMGFLTSMCSVLKILKTRICAKQRLVICLST